MRGLELARAYYDSCRPILYGEIPDIMAQATAGLAGEGSECFGMDDIYSRDHDFGAAFCLWLPAIILKANEERINRAFSLLPLEFAGCKSRFFTPGYGIRIGPLAVEPYFAFFTNIGHIPATLHEWLAMREFNLAAATNGDIFEDNCQLFAEWRKKLLAYYPRDVFLKKLAAQCMQTAQAGQYNLPRCLKRGDQPAAFLALARFAEAALSLVYLLNKKYMPFYKWAPAKARKLPVLGSEITLLLEELSSTSLRDMNPQTCCQLIEHFCERCSTHLQAYSGIDDAWLWAHGPALAAMIEDASLQGMDILQA